MHLLHKIQQLYSFFYLSDLNLIEDFHSFSACKTELVIRFVYNKNELKDKKLLEVKNATK